MLPGIRTARRRHRRSRASAAFLFEAVESRQLLTAYYISPAGNDANAGTSSSAPWKSINRVNSVDLNAGDQVLLQGGATFNPAANSTTNLVTDGGFESGNFNSWTENFDATAGNTTITTTSGNYHSGAKAMRVGGTGNGGRGQVVTSKLSANHTYLLKVWAKLSSGTGNAYAGVTFSSNGNEVGKFSFKITSSTWTQYSAAVVAPAGFDFADVWVTKNDGTSVLYVDDVTLNESFGTMVLNAADSGTASNPVTIGSYGSGRATINSGDGFGIYGQNVGGVNVQDLGLAGNWNGLAATGTNAAYGVYFINKLSNDTKLSYIHIEDMDVGGFKWGGIGVEGGNGKAGYTDVRITNSVAHDNGDQGIGVEGSFSATSTAYAHSGVYIGYCQAFNNGGLPNKGNNSGTGIIIGDTDGGTIERCVAWNNGQNCNFTGGGPIGIWAWDANNIAIQYNESYANQTGSASLDGGGFDFDGGVTNSVIQYNYSHDNDGAGYLLYQFTGARGFGGNTVRYNISQNDGRHSHYAGIYMGGGSAVANNDIYQNTVYISPTSDTTIAAVKITGVGANNQLRNNIFYTTGGATLLNSNSAYSSSSVLFQGNDWYASGGSFSIKWGGTTYTDLSTWRNTGQEKYNGGAVGASSDPKFVSAGGGGTIGDATRLGTLTAYQLQSSSPLINKGVKLSNFSIDPGTRDFYGFGNNYGAAPDIGAFESSPTYSASNANDQFIMRLGPSGNVEVFVNAPTTSAPTLAWDKSVFSSFVFYGNGGDDQMTLDLSNGNPLPSGGATFNGGTQVNGDSLIVAGSAASDTIALTGSTVTPAASGPALNYAGVGDVVVNSGGGNDQLLINGSGDAQVTFNSGSGSNALSVNAGTYVFPTDAGATASNLAVTVAAPASAVFESSQHLASLTVAGAATVALGGDKAIVTRALSITGGGKLDLNDNALIVDYAAGVPLPPIGAWDGSKYTGITGLVASGYHAGAWDGSGIISSKAKSNGSHYGMGVADAADVLDFSAASTALFAGETVDSSAVLVRFTFIGDSNLDGTITGDDYARIDASASHVGVGYARGDFDFDGAVGGDDYFFIDSNYAAAAAGAALLA